VGGTNWISFGGRGTKLIPPLLDTKGEDVAQCRVFPQGEWCFSKCNCGPLNTGECSTGQPTCVGVGRRILLLGGKYWGKTRSGSFETSSGRAAEVHLLARRALAGGL